MPKILVQFCYLRRYFGIDIVSRRLSVAEWIARIENGLKLTQQQDTGYTASS